jgi:hypothetical protein
MPVVPPTGKSIPQGASPAATTTLLACLDLPLSPPLTAAW